MNAIGPLSKLPAWRNEPEPTKPTTWTIYKIAAKQMRLGTVDAPDEREAVAKAAEEFRQPASKLIAIRRT